MAADSSGRGYDISQWYDSRPVKIGWFAMLAIGVFWVLYQRTFGYSHGLDSMTPEFESVWMGLWRFNIVANAAFFAISVGWIWVTRDRNLANLDPKLELKRYFYWMGWLVCYIWGVYYAGSYTLEQDAAWHQVIIRDTSFTASHIVAFYGTFPLYITCGVSSYLYAQTRLRCIARRRRSRWWRRWWGRCSFCRTWGSMGGAMRSGLWMSCSRRRCTGAS
jgi:methane/ammonia monooxygenase subunit C